MTTHTIEVLAVVLGIACAVAAVGFVVFVVYAFSEWMRNGSH